MGLGKSLGRNEEIKSHISVPPTHHLISVIFSDGARPGIDFSCPYTRSSSISFVSVSPAAGDTPPFVSTASETWQEGDSSRTPTTFDTSTSSTYSCVPLGRYGLTTPFSTGRGSPTTDTSGQNTVPFTVSFSPTRLTSVSPRVTCGPITVSVFSPSVFSTSDLGRRTSTESTVTHTSIPPTSTVVSLASGSVVTLLSTMFGSGVYLSRPGV